MLSVLSQGESMIVPGKSHIYRNIGFALPIVKYRRLVGRDRVCVCVCLILRGERQFKP